MKTFKSLLFIISFFLISVFVFAQKDFPIMRFGLIADIQYADADEKIGRYYRNSLSKLDSCVIDLNAHQVDFTINLGDLIDKNHNDLEQVLTRLAKLDQTCYNTTGNHDYSDTTDNDLLFDKLDMPAEYYSFYKNNWLFIMLNTNELSSYANIEGTWKQKEWEEIMDNINTHSHNNGLPWNGGISSRQMEWLGRELDSAQKSGQNVLVFTHHPLYPFEDFTALNGEEILKTLAAFACVKGVISGHHHTGAFSTYKGIPCITTEGMVETENENAYAIVDIYKDKIVLNGKGRAKSHTIRF